MDNKIGNANYKDEHNLIFGNQTFNIEGKNNNNNKLEIYNYEKIILIQEKKLKPLLLEMT